MASAYTSNGTPSYDDPASKPLFGETRPKASCSTNQKGNNKALGRLRVAQVGLRLCCSQILKDIDIDIEILFCVDYSTTCNISPVELLLRQTRINKHF